MGRIGRPKEEISLYDKYIKGKEEVLIADCRNGADQAGLAKRVGCGYTTFKKILRRHPELREILKEGNEEADLKVESALYRRALGYEYEETSTEVRVDPSGGANTTFVKKTKKFIPPDTTAQIFWLKNRNSENWRDRQEHKVSVDPFMKLLQELPDDPNDLADK